MARALASEDGNLQSSTIITSRSRDYKDIDLTFSKKVNTGDIFKKTDAAAVKQAVKTLLSTSQLEKPFLPDFGADLRDLLFELADYDIELETRLKIEKAIQRYEPRANLLDIDVRSDPDYNSLSVTTTFKIVSTEETISFTTVVSRLR